MKILVHHLELFGCHGFTDAEQQRLQPFALDLELEGDFGHEDRLEATADYSQVIAKVEEINANNSFRLIETFASAVAAGILEAFPQVERVRVRLKKLHPPLPPGTAVGWVAAEVVRER
ncbi:MAG: dihydroneopterin aldolase [Candidatus Acetothermia bacterium]|nr:dihydroneopterin aldolase [Candidatus Acetothermia bacterium]MDH7505446.1 dihydroneopterin aldolase [Candidatus Acetothermia bacterium]